MEGSLKTIGGNMYECRPLLVTTPDGLVVLSAMGSVINALSAKTGELLGSFTQHPTLVSSISQATHNSQGQKNIVSSSVDGSIFVWNLSTFAVVSSSSINSPLFDIQVPYLAKFGQFLAGSAAEDASALDIVEQRLREELYIVSGVLAPESNGVSTIRAILYDTKVSKLRRRVAPVSKPRNGSALMLLNGADKNQIDEILITVEDKKLTLWSLNNKTIIGKIKSDSDCGMITCISVCSRRGIVTTGHDYGMICLWHNIDSLVRSMAAEKTEKTTAKCTTMHWHAHAVTSISFTADGNHIVSGGEEGVLVVWQVDTGFKAFVPRLGAAITNLHCSDTDPYVAVTTSDNTIRIVNTASLQEEWNLKHICVAQRLRKFKSGTLSDSQILSYSGNGFYQYRQADNNFRCSIAVDERSGFIACNGYPGELQMISASPIVKFSHQVLPFLRVSKKEAYTKMYVPSVSIFRFFNCTMGSFLATVDVTRGHDTAPGYSIKFWIWSAAKNKYRLSAAVDAPHDSSRVTDLDFIPQNDNVVCCATCSVDSSVKVWQGKYIAVPLTTNQSTGKGNGNALAESQQLKWTCAFSFTHREVPAFCLKSSFDGSLLAIGHANSISLWDPSNVSIKHTFTSNSTSVIFFVRFIEPLARPAFGGGCGVCYLVLGSKDTLQVYDLLTLELQWALCGDFDCFAVAKNESYCFNVGALHEKGVTGQGWIAVCSNEKEAGLSEGSVKIIRKISIYSPMNSTCLLSSSTASKIISAEFYCKPADTSNICAGSVVLISELGQLLHLSRSSDESITDMSTIAGNVLVRQIRHVQFGVQFSSESTIGVNDGNVLVPNREIKSIYSALEDTSSQHLPSVHEIYDSFMMSLLPQPARLEELEPVRTGPIALIKSKGNSLEKKLASSLQTEKSNADASSKKRSAVQISADEIQDIFASSLAGVFQKDSSSMIISIDEPISIETATKKSKASKKVTIVAPEEPELPKKVLPATPKPKKSR